MHNNQMNKQMLPEDCHTSDAGVIILYTKLG